MASDKGRVEIPMVKYEARQEPSAPEYCSQGGKQPLLGMDGKSKLLAGSVANINGHFLTQAAHKGPNLATTWGAQNVPVPVYKSQGWGGQAGMIC